MTFELTDRDTLSVRVAKSYVDEFGCKIDVDPEYRDLYALDFIVTRIRGIHSALNIGVRITAESLDPADQEKLAEAVRLGVVPRAVYLELPRQSHDAGGLRVAFSATIAYAFDQQYEGVAAVGIHVRPDNSFHIYDLEGQLRRRRRDQHNAAHTETDRLQGNIIAYFAGKGYGFIESSDGEKFFFHIAGIESEALRSDLTTLGAGVTIPVEFRFGGSDGRKYPKAIDVQRIDAN